MTPEQARGLAAQAWCTPATQRIEMDADLVQAFADILSKAVAEEREQCAVLASKGGCTQRGCGIVSDGTEWHSDQCPLGIAAALRAQEVPS